MSIMRNLLALLISLGLVLSPVGVAVGAVSHGVEMAGMAANFDAAADASGAELAPVDMADCHKSMASGDCTCCDAKSKCPDQASCMMKCCKVLTTFRPAAQPTVHSDMHYRLTATAKPPPW
ncbi:MAG: hypothetical protein ABL907_04865, partial [Hyphomicrobium sp.]